MQTKNEDLRTGIVVALLLSSVLITVTVNEAYAKCMAGDYDCYGTPMIPPLNIQFEYFALPDITCPNQDHVIAERPNGKLACVTDSMAEKTGWHVHYKNMVDFKGEVLVSPGAVSWVSFEITGATLDRMVYEDQMLVASVTPNDEYGILSIELPSGSLPAHFDYCNPNNKNPFDTPFVIIIDGEEYPLDESVNSRGQTAINISLDANSETIEIIRTCNEPSKEPSTDFDSKKMEDVQDLENMRKSILELEFGDDIITVLISDEAYFGAMTSFEFTTIPVSSLLQAHNMLPKTSMNDRIITGSILSEIVKAGTYITQNEDKEFWYTIGGIESQVITIELQDHEFDRIVFVSDKNHEWIGQINDIVDSRK